MSKRAPVLAAAVAAVLAITTGTAVAAPSFSAHGSVEQVYVTGLEPGQDTLLIDGAGKTVAQRQAGALGGLLFRDVKPGSGYRVRAVKGGEQSDELTVLAQTPAPPSTDVYSQTLPESGY